MNYIRVCSAEWIEAIILINHNYQLVVSCLVHCIDVLQQLSIATCAASLEYLT